MKKDILKNDMLIEEEIKDSNDKLLDSDNHTSQPVTSSTNIEDDDEIRIKFNYYNQQLKVLVDKITF